MTALDEVRIGLTRDGAELAAAAELVCAYVPNLNSAAVRRWYREAASEPTTVVAVAVGGDLVVGTLLSRVDEQLRAAVSAERLGMYRLLQYAAVAPRWRGRASAGDWSTSSACICGPPVHAGGSAAPRTPLPVSSSRAAA